MMDPQILSSFRACQRYKNAPAWRKPLINPARFLRNQARKRGLAGGRPGEPCLVAAFHEPHFTVVNGETVSENIAGYGLFEDTLTEAFLRLVQPAQAVVDIGMHLGYYATLFARLVGPQGVVHAFEPTPSTRELAMRNVGRFPNITVHPFAVWSRLERLTFHDYGPQWMAFNSFAEAQLGGSAPPAREFTVETTTLDSFREQLGRPIALVKVDAESAEQQILEGARQFLKTDRPLITLEVGDDGGARNSRGLIEFMQGQDYAAWEFQGGRFIRHALRPRYEYDNLVFAPVAVDLSAR